MVPREHEDSVCVPSAVTLVTEADPEGVTVGGMNFCIFFFCIWRMRRLLAVRPLLAGQRPSWYLADGPGAPVVWTRCLAEWSVGSRDLRAGSDPPAAAGFLPCLQLWHSRGKGSAGRGAVLGLSWCTVGLGTVAACCRSLVLSLVSGLGIFLWFLGGESPFCSVFSPRKTVPRVMFLKWTGKRMGQTRTRKVFCYALTYVWRLIFKMKPILWDHLFFFFFNCQRPVQLVFGVVLVFIACLLSALCLLLRLALLSFNSV